MSPPVSLDEPWVAIDQTRWLYFPQYGEWHGWAPGEDGLFVYTVAEFRRIYPDAPAWDAA
jgi:hypothetical protein